MSISHDELRALPAAEKLRIVEMLWNDLASGDEPIPLPESVEREASRRRDEMVGDQSLGLSHGEVWRRIEGRDG